MISDKVQMNQLYSDFYVKQIFDNSFYKNNAENESRFVMDTLQLSPMNRVADIACGSGYHATSFANYFKYVYGIDISTACIQMALQLKSNCHFLEADSIEFASKHIGEFDLVTNFGVSLGYSEDLSENEKVLDAISMIVKKNGYLVVQFLNKIWALKKFAQPTTFWSEDLLHFTLDKREINPNQKMLSSTKIFIEKTHGAVHRFEDSVYLYEFSELRDSFLKRGFKFTNVFATHKGDQFVEENSPTPFLFFQKC